MYLDNDYLVQESKIYGIRGNWPQDAGRILGKPVYEQDENGRFNKIVDIPGDKGESMVWVDTRKSKHVKSWGVEDNAFETSTPWGQMVASLLKIGIQKEEIGYFGSRRLGLSQPKDVDFILYGMRAYECLRQNMDFFKELSNTYNFDKEHAEYQASKHGAYYAPFANSLINCLMNKWSSCMFRKGLCSTLRFVNPSLLTFNKIQTIFEAEGEIVTINGIVVDDTGTSFMPREFRLKVGQKVYDVMTCAWIFHQCVKMYDSVQVTGIFINQQIIVRDYCHGIRHL